MTDLLLVNMRQNSGNAERMANLKVKQITEDMRDLKHEVSEERERIREKNREQDTLLIKAESKVAVLDEQLKALKAELAVKQKKIEELQSNEAKY